MHLETTMLSEINQIGKFKYYIISLIWTPKLYTKIKDNCKWGIDLSYIGMGMGSSNGRKGKERGERG